MNEKKLVVETKTGLLAIFPGDTPRDVAFAKQMNRRII
jgi:hypothetical protein